MRSLFKASPLLLLVTAPLSAQKPDSVDVVAAIHRFHAALAAGDSAAALRLLTPDVVVIEAGDVENFAHYREHHLAADIEFARAVPSQKGEIHVRVSGAMASAWSTSTTKGTFRNRAINSAGAELMVLRKIGGAWRISAIHWSSHSIRAYYPARDNWEHRAPASLGFNAARLDSAIAYAKTQTDTTRTDSLGIAEARPSEKPYNATVGPWLTPRGPEGGIVIRNGYIVAEWGEPNRVDMTFSVTKSFLSTIAALASDANRITLTDPVSKTVRIPEFTADPHNAAITWHQLLNQTSEWQGTLWDKPDWADRFNPRTGKRPVKDPGSTWTYNDVRVNALALALLHVWRRPLPDVLKESIMDPIGASSTWRWWGYNNSYVDIDGKRIQSVSGGGHWGGGMHINAYDMARYGLLFLRNGRWNDRQLLSERWIATATSPTDVKPDYGYLWWLGKNKTFSAQGAGGNYIYVDPVNDVVVVLRWTRDFSGVIDRITSSLEKPQ